jgi:hypothetical protein
MEIKINESYRIVSDKRQYILQKRKVVKNEVFWVGHMYFGTLESAFKAIPEQFLKDSDAKGWSECAEVLKSTKTALLEALSLEKGDG